MQPDPILENYAAARIRFYEELERLKGSLDALLAAMRERDATMEDLARLEGLHAEKHRLFTEFIAVEDQFVEQLLARRREAQAESV